MEHLAQSETQYGVVLTDPFLRLGRFVARHPWWILALWLVAIILGAWGAHRLGQVTVGVEGGVRGSPSALAAEVLNREFSNPFTDPVVVAVAAPHLKVDEGAYLRWIQQAAHTLASLPQVHRV